MPRSLCELPPDSPCPQHSMEIRKCHYIIQCSIEASTIGGGALDGAGNAETGWLIRGGREMEDHFECLWDLYRSIPSLEIEGASVLDEFYWLNKDDPNRSLQRATIERGQDAKTGMDFTLTSKRAGRLSNSFLRFPNNSTTSESMKYSARMSSTRTSGSTGERCLPSRSGTAHWR